MTAPHIKLSWDYYSNSSGRRQTGDSCFRDEESANWMRGSIERAARGKPQIEKTRCTSDDPYKCAIAAEESKPCPTTNAPTAPTLNPNLSTAASAEKNVAASGAPLHSRTKKMATTSLTYNGEDRDDIGTALAKLQEDEATLRALGPMDVNSSWWQQYAEQSTQGATVAKRWIETVEHYHADELEAARNTVKTITEKIKRNTASARLFTSMHAAFMDLWMPALKADGERKRREEEDAQLKLVLEERQEIVEDLQTRATAARLTGDVVEDEALTAQAEEIKQQPLIPPMVPLKAVQIPAPKGQTGRVVWYHSIDSPRVFATFLANCEWTIKSDEENYTQVEVNAIGIEFNFTKHKSSSVALPGMVVTSGWEGRNLRR